MREASDPRLDARGLSFSIGKNHIVHHFDITVRRGEVLGLIGPNGAGKTTAIDLLSGFRLPDSGYVRVNGKEVTRLAPDRRVLCGLARTFQESPGVSGLSVLEHVQLAVDAAGRRRAGRSAPSPEELLDNAGLWEVRNQPGTSLPIGQRRMLDLARALGTSPDVLLLDEPFAGLEDQEEKRLIDAVHRLRARDSGIVVIEHRLSLLNNVADSVVVLVQGTPLAAGMLADLLDDPRVQKAYLGTAGGEAAK